MQWILLVCYPSRLKASFCFQPRLAKVDAVEEEEGEGDAVAADSRGPLAAESSSKPTASAASANPR